MDAARAQAPLRNLKAATLAQDHVLDRDFHVLELDFAMAVRRVVIAEHRQHAQDLDARRIGIDEDLRLGAVAAAFGIGLAHHDHDLAARVADARRPPLAAVDDIVIALALDARFDVRGIRRGDSRLGHQEGGADLALQERLQPFVLLIRAAIALQHFHVAGVGGGAVEHLRGETDTAHDLGQRGVFKVGQTGAVFAFVEEEVPQALLLGLGLLLELLHDRVLDPGIALGARLVHLRARRPFRQDRHGRA